MGTIGRTRRGAGVIATVALLIGGCDFDVAVDLGTDQVAGTQFRGDWRSANAQISLEVASLEDCREERAEILALLREGFLDAEGLGCHREGFEAFYRARVALPVHRIDWEGSPVDIHEEAADYARHAHPSSVLSVGVTNAKRGYREIVPSAEVVLLRHPSRFERLSDAMQRQFSARPQMREGEITLDFHNDFDYRIDLEVLGARVDGRPVRRSLIGLEPGRRASLEYGEIAIDSLDRHGWVSLFTLGYDTEFDQWAYSHEPPETPLDTYLGFLRSALERAFHYPQTAREEELEGVVTVRMVIDHDGELVEISAAETSGHAVLDEAAVAILKDAAPFAPIPRGGDEPPLELVLPIQFSL